MKYIDEYRNPQALKKYLMLIEKVAKKPWTIMEVCGGQTHAIVKYRLQELLPKGIELVHGPGCPVCVTSQELIDKAIMIASNASVIFCSFGDMLRVPGSQGSLLTVKAEGADIRLLYSPFDALAIARKYPNRQVVFFAVGFETTAPSIAMTIYQAKKMAIKNFSVLISHFLVPPAIEAILNSEQCRIQGFLAAGHVCTIMGCSEYYPISHKYRVPIVVTGFEPLDIIEGIYLCIRQLESGRSEVENQYSRSVRKDGNQEAYKMLQEVFHPSDTKWRGIGEIAKSGLRLNKGYEQFDAMTRFLIKNIPTVENHLCISADILQGLKKPHQCKSFAKQCTPEYPLGAPMVSTEGACAAYFRYRGLNND